MASSHDPKAAVRGVSFFQIFRTYFLKKKASEDIFWNREIQMQFWKLFVFRLKFRGIHEQFLHEFVNIESIDTNFW